MRKKNRKVKTMKYQVTKEEEAANRETQIHIEPGCMGQDSDNVEYYNFVPDYNGDYTIPEEIRKRVEQNE